MNKKSIDNLVHFTSETGREAQKKGLAVRRKNIEERKKMAETLDVLLKKAKRKGKMVNASDIENLADAEGLNVDTQTAILVALVQRATMGDVQAIQFIRDTIGEKPTDKVEIDESKTIETWAKTHEIKL